MQHPCTSIRLVNVLDIFFRNNEHFDYLGTQAINKGRAKCKILKRIRRRPPLSTNLLAYSETASRKRNLSWIYRNRRKLKSIFSFSEIFLRRANTEAETFVTFFFIQQLLSHTERQFARPDTPQRASLVCSDPDLDVGDIP